MGTLLFDAALRAELPVASSCSAAFVCGRCDMEIVDNPQALSPQKEIELALLKRQGRPAHRRISCVTRVFGDCTVTTTYW